MSQKKLTLIFSILLITFAVVARLVPHMANVAPIAALALFSGVYLDKKYAFVVPMIALLVSDMFIGFYSLPIMASVYGSFALIGIMGITLKKKKTFARTALTTLSGSITFFIVTNWAVWAFSPLYTKTIDGLMQSYLMGLPFLRGTVLGDLLYVAVLFGIYELSLYFASQRSKQKETTAIV